MPNNLLASCDFCHSIFDESMIDMKCPICSNNNPLNYKPYEVELKDLIYPYPKLNHPSDFIYPSIFHKKSNAKVSPNKNRYNKTHFFHIIPIYEIYEGKRILNQLAVTWDWNWNGAYAIMENPDKLMNYYLSNFSLENYTIAHDNCKMSVYTIVVPKEKYNKFNERMQDVMQTNLGNYYQLYTSINWDNYEDTAFKKTFYEYAAVNYLLHMMEICGIGKYFHDIDDKLVSFEYLNQHPDIHLIETAKDIDIKKFLDDEKEQKLFSTIKEDYLTDLIGISENDLSDIEEIFDYYSNLAEGAIAPNSVPLSSAAVRSTKVYNKLYDVYGKNADPSIHIYNKGDKTCICPTVTLGEEVYYIECNENLLEGINIFNNYDEMESTLEEVYNEAMEKSIFISIHKVPIEVMNFIINNVTSNKEFLSRLVELKNKYDGSTDTNLINPIHTVEEVVHEGPLKDFRKIPITSSSLYKYRATHYKLKDLQWLGDMHGNMYINDNTDSIVAYAIAKDKTNEGGIYREIPSEIITEIIDINIVAAYRNRKTYLDIIHEMVKDYQVNTIAVRDSNLESILKEQKYQMLGQERNTKYYWIEGTHISLDESIVLNEAINPDKRKKIEDLIYGTFDILDKTGSNTKKYRDLFGKMSNEEFDKYMRDFFKNPKKQFYLECLPNRNSPRIQDGKEALEFLGIPAEEYVWYRHNGHQSNPIRTRYKVPVLYVNLRRLQQILSKKNTWSLDINKRNLKTGQLSGDNRIARISDAENYCLLTYKTDNYALKEFLSARSDSLDAKNEMYKEISRQGYCYMKDLPNDIKKKQSINTVSILLVGAGLDNDLTIPDNLISTLNKLSK